MKKTLNSILVILFAINLKSQDSLKFISKIYVKDAFDNIDSVTIGTSYYGDNVYNPEFGELAIDTPFDSILEIRAGHNNGPWDFLEQDYILSKKIISRSEEINGKSGVPIRLFIYAKHQPITISWSEDFLDPRYFLGTYMTPDAHHAVVNPIDWWELNPVRYQCMNKFTSYIVELNSNAVQDFEYPYFVKRPVIGSDNITDSIFGVQITFEQHEMYSPCQLVSIIKDDLDKQSFTIYPNPVGDLFRFPENIEVLEIYGINGNLIKTFSKSGEYFVGDLIEGLYIMKGKVGKNWLTGKLIKS